MSVIQFVPTEEIQRIRAGIADRYERASATANLIRINALSMITFAGSGHVGTSLSSLDVVTWLWTEILRGVAPEAPGPGDRYFSSKGHDVPGLYALLIGLGYLDEAYLTGLRRLGGLPGHPDRATPYMVTNTGSLGMGISKARGLARANRLDGLPGRIYVLTGDGELQEGQFWESLQPTVNEGFGEIIVIVDHNKIQSDLLVDSVSPLGDLEAKVAAFGWAVTRCDGHDMKAIDSALTGLNVDQAPPGLLIADTVKGRGVSFMEGATLGQDELYRFHSGAPTPEHYEQALTELVTAVNEELESNGLPAVRLRQEAWPARVAPTRPQRLISAYGEELVAVGRDHPEVVVLDGDLMVDTGTLPFRREFPDRFIECGIAEQDMVSQAGALAIKGKVPIVHSFACFLSTRPNEQIFNNGTDRAKVIYHASLAGLLPAGPGHSHQSVRDIAAVGSVPGLTMVQPATEWEARLALRWAVEENDGSTWLRLTSVPWPTAIASPAGERLVPGRGTILRDGTDAAVIAYGPVMIREALCAAQLLSATGLSVRVANLPWLNVVDDAWLAELVAAVDRLVLVEDHSPDLGQASFVLAALARLKSTVATQVFGVEGIPVSGQNAEVLDYHGLSATRLAERIRAFR
jgi:transketolase